MIRADRSIFSQLSETTRRALLSRGHIQQVQKGEILLHETGSCDTLLILFSGYAALYRDSFQGDSRTIFILSDGEILNEVCLDGGKPAVSAAALSECSVLYLPMEDAEALLKNADFARAVFQSLARKSRRLYHKVGNDNGTYPLKNRLAATLWKLTRDYGTDTEKGRRLGFDLSVNFLATYMGAKRESVSRALSEMKKNGLILHEGGSLTVLDMQRLKDAISQNG